MRISDWSSDVCSSDLSISSRVSVLIKYRVASALLATSNIPASLPPAVCPLAVESFEFAERCGLPQLQAIVLRKRRDKQRRFMSERVWRSGSICIYSLCKYPNNLPNNKQKTWSHIIHQK